MPARSLLRWITGICLIVVLVNTGLVLPRAARDLQRLSQILYQDALWRGAFFHRGERMANYLQFIRQTLPPNMEIVLPEIANLSADNMLSTPAMQFYLLPWRVRNCRSIECLQKANLRSSILCTTKAEAKLLTEFPGTIKSFDSAWGIYLPPSLPINPDPEPSPNKNGSIWGEGIGVFALLSYLTLAGFSFCAGLEITLQEKIAIGYGLGLFGFSLLTTVGCLLGSDFTPLLLITSAGLMGLFSLFFLKQKLSIRFIPSLLRSRIIISNRWMVGYLAFAVLSAVLSIGKGYSVSDEIQLWGLKGYGIATDHSLIAITQWGTNTTTYPLHIPILIGGFRQLFGDHLPASKVIFSGFYFCLLLYLDGIFSRIVPNRSTRALAVLALGTVPLVFRHSTLAYANLPYSVYLVTGATSFFELTKWRGAFQETGDSSLSRGLHQKTGLICASLFCAAMWTRPEGLYFVGLIVLSGMGYWLNRYYCSQKDKNVTNLLIKANKGNNTKNKFFPLSLNWLMFGIPLVLYLLLWLVVKRQIYPQPLREGQIFERMIAGILGRNFHLSELGYLLQEWGLRSLNPEVWGAGGFAIIVCLVIWLWQAKRGARILSPMFVSGIIITGGVLFLYYLLIFDTNHDISWWVSTSFDRLWMPAFIFLWIGGWQQCCSNCVVD